MTRLTTVLSSLPAALLLLVVSLAAFIVVIVSTNPLDVGPVGAMAVFLLMYVCFFAVFLIAMQAYLRIRYGKGTELEPGIRKPTGRGVTVAAVWAIAPIVVMALNSTGQLDLLSVVLIVIFEVLASVYVFRR